MHLKENNEKAEHDCPPVAIIILLIILVVVVAITVLGIVVVVVAIIVLKYNHYRHCKDRKCNLLSFNFYAVLPDVYC